jgi:hypothetical protein
MQGKSLLPTFEERNDSKGQHARKDYGTELSDNPSNTRVGVLVCDIPNHSVTAARPIFRRPQPYSTSPLVDHEGIRGALSLSISTGTDREAATEDPRACTVLTNPSHSHNFAQGTEDGDDFPPARHHTVQVGLNFHNIDIAHRLALLLARSCASCDGNKQPKQVPSFGVGFQPPDTPQSSKSAKSRVFRVTTLDTSEEWDGIPHQRLKTVLMGGSGGMRRCLLWILVLLACVGIFFVSSYMHASGNLQKAIILSNQVCMYAAR